MWATLLCIIYELGYVVDAMSGSQSRQYLSVKVEFAKYVGCFCVKIFITTEHVSAKECFDDMLWGRFIHECVLFYGFVPRWEAWFFGSGEGVLQPQTARQRLSNLHSN